MSAPATDTWAEQVVVVTGASQGIGRAMAIELARSGARVGLVARTTAKLEAVADECRARGGDVLVLPTDITDRRQCAHMVDSVVSAYGAIHAVINNAGISVVARFEELEDLTLPELVMQVNYLGALNVTGCTLPHLIASRGRLVAVASLTGRAGVPLRSIYAASKHAMVGFFDSLRIELKQRGVSVTVAYPDFVQTEVKERVFGPKGERLAIHPAPGTRFISAETCARRILEAALQRKRDVVLSLRGRIGKWLQLLAPALVDRMAESAMRRVHYGEPRGPSTDRPPANAGD